ncbi:phosphoenolpyruvate-protein phosphotransferase PtsP [Psychromonas sp. psych-6C06]|uniref:phosphoenolpyruvate--protein phosphotransferase n=1 Tax=Psychromonas sp. psych-6C06 TaxID=2058089 RepID=UPI000C34AB68|nr:phosphoenolpyruvate--protein phosphotransferase [Psychromonas sp. psych-6C06]PKF61736.1 phosphoenolpyruvate-protein phosphotransferase PtsP [Psychromonas sp. psych-6C06]
MLSQLRHIVEQVGNATNLTLAMDTLVKQTKSVMEVDCCTIYITDDGTQKLNLMASEGLLSQGETRHHLKFGEGIVGLIHQKGEPLNLANITEHPHYKYLPGSQEDDFSSFLGTPIIHQRQVLGVLVAQQKIPRLFSELEESFLVTLAMHLASVLANSGLRLQINEDQHPSSALHLQGSPASSGIAIAPAYVVRPILTLDEVEIEKSHSPSKDILLFEMMLKKCRDEFSSMALTLKEQLSKEAFALFDIYSHVLKDKAFIDAIRLQINEQHLTASSAIKVVSESFIAQFEAMSDAYLRERASDIRDVAQRLLYHLTQQVDEHIKLPDKLILVANEVTLSMLASVPTEHLHGIISVHGGVSSHVAILARALGVPAVMGVPLSLINLNQQMLIIDGYAGAVVIFPTQPLIKHYQQLLAEEDELKLLVSGGEHKPALTVDGQKIDILLNTGLNANQHGAVEGQFDGIGLYRSELPFMLTNVFPTELEQVAIYQTLLTQYRTLPVTMRTLDIGGDKQLSYFPIVEDNPFLGWRGIRLTLDHPEIFLMQIRGMLSANLHTQNLRIMLPMVSNIEEVVEAKLLIYQAWNEIKYELGLTPEAFPIPPIGVMIEVPASIFIIKQLAQQVDFLSIGSNDLIQYLLAVDRNNSRVASLFDSYHPAVLQCLKMIIDNAQEGELEVSVCGELAGDPIGAMILLGLGYKKLSMNANNMGKIKYLINNVPMHELNNCIEIALEANSGAEIRTVFVNYLDRKGLGGFIRAGK